MVGKSFGKICFSMLWARSAVAVPAQLHIWPMDFTLEPIQTARWKLVEEDMGVDVGAYR